jgi:hypothetical protein
MQMNIPGSAKPTMRGSISVADKTKSDMPGASWTDLDLTSIFGAGRRLVLLGIELQNTDGSTYVAFRTNGTSATFDDIICRSTVPDTAIHFQVLVETDSNGLLEWFGVSTNVTTLNVFVRGWWDL